MQDRLLTVEQVAERLSLQVWTIRQWLRTGKLAGTKLGSEWRVSENDLQALIEAGRNTTAS